jgi:hypothetical protein
LLLENCLLCSQASGAAAYLTVDFSGEESCTIRAKFGAVPTQTDAIVHVKWSVGNFSLDTPSTLETVKVSWTGAVFRVFVTPGASDLDLYLTAKCQGEDSCFIIARNYCYYRKSYFISDTTGISVCVGLDHVINGVLIDAYLITIFFKSDCQLTKQIQIKPVPLTIRQV